MSSPFRQRSTNYIINQYVSRMVLSKRLNTEELPQFDIEEALFFVKLLTNDKNHVARMNEYSFLAVFSKCVFSRGKL